MSVLPGFGPEGTEYSQWLLLILMQYQSASIIMWEKRRKNQHGTNIKIYSKSKTMLSFCQSLTLVDSDDMYYL